MPRTLRTESTKTADNVSSSNMHANQNKRGKKRVIPPQMMSGREPREKRVTVYSCNAWGCNRASSKYQKIVDHQENNGHKGLGIGTQVIYTQVKMSSPNETNSDAQRSTGQQASDLQQLTLFTLYPAELAELNSKVDILCTKVEKLYRSMGNLNERYLRQAL